MRHFYVLMLLISGALSCQQAGPLPAFLQAALEISDLDARQAWIDQVMDSLEAVGQIPYLKGDTAIFLYQAKGKEAMVAGDFNQWNPEGTRMGNLKGTDLWYYSLPAETGARLDYKFVRDDRSWHLDPRNARKNGSGAYINSELRMPGYHPPAETVYDSTVARGRLDTLAVDTQAWPLCKALIVYTPPGMDSLGSYPTVYLHDGLDQVRNAQVPIILNNLMAAGEIQPVIAVFLEPNDRNQDYAFERQGDFARFVVQEVVPFIDDHYPTSSQAADRMTMGASFAGLISMMIAYSYPEVFGNCGIHSGAYWPNEGAAMDFLEKNLHAPVKYAAIWGSYDGVRRNNEKVIGLFEAVGKEVLWAVHPQGHTWPLWRDTTGDFLRYFFPGNPR
ncbi:MAG: alpha/beta hydrolase-fold protein [Bacteroidota bacterium]